MNSYRLAPLCLMLGSAILVSGMVGCGVGDETGSYAVTDSAGVEIVMNSGPAWSEGEGWRVDPEPSLTIGTVAGDPAYELHEVAGAVRLPDGTIVVLNSGSYELRYFDEAGRHLLSAGGEGEGPGSFQGPYLIFVLAGDTVVVWDQRQRRMSFFGRAGEYVRSFTLPIGESMYFAKALFGDRAVLATARVRMPSSQQSGPTRGKNLFVVFDLEGDSVATLGAFHDREMYARYDEKAVGTAARVLGRTTVMTTYGSALYVGTNDSYAIDRYVNEPIRLPDGDETVMSQGVLTRSVRRDIRAPVTDEMFAAEIEATLESLSGPYGDMMGPVFEGMSKPDVLPHYSAIKADVEGNLWVRHYISRTMPSFEWTVFDAAGRMLGDVTLPERFDVYEIGRDYILGRWRDDADVEYVLLHRFSK